MRREDRVRLLLITYLHGQPGPVGSSLERSSGAAEGLGAVVGSVASRWSSYAPLEKALRWLKAEHPDVYTAVCRFYVLDRPTVKDRLKATEGVNVLTGRMPMVIHVPKDILANAEVLLRRKVRT